MKEIINIKHKVYIEKKINNNLNILLNTLNINKRIIKFINLFKTT
jgi:hypothetical protein